jgi:Tfp pilus assembly protein PilE
LDLRKSKLFKSGLTEADRKLQEEQANVEKKFKEEQGAVRQTTRTKGWQIIIDKMVSETEGYKLKLETCGLKEVSKLQAEIKVRKNFLNQWTPYIES